MKPLIKEILQRVVDNGLHYCILCENEVIVELTRDLDLACSSLETVAKDEKHGHYVGINAVDVAHIYVCRYTGDKDDYLEYYDPETDEYAKWTGYANLGWIHWNNFNEGAERVSDWSTALEKRPVLLTTVLREWEKEYEYL
tara:strand:+ start:2528 stop:2950 length:423 start_codon:yes stop_codon:yes gene_type:complete